MLSNSSFRTPCQVHLLRVMCRSSFGFGPDLRTKNAASMMSMRMEEEEVVRVAVIAAVVAVVVAVAGEEKAAAAAKCNSGPTSFVASNTSRSKKQSVPQTQCSGCGRQQLIATPFDQGSLEGLSRDYSDPRHRFRV